MTRDEFEAIYAERSSVTVGMLHDWGRYAERCPHGDDCDVPDCSGWVMGHPWEDAILEDELRSRIPRTGGDVFPGGT